MAFSWGQEGIVILVIIILLFGAGSIPKLARSLGQAKGEFSKAKKEFDRELTDAEKKVQEETQIRKTARDLGIEEKDRPIEEVKAALNEKLR